MNVCVFCGSATGTNPVYADAARTFARQLSRRGHALIYGGGNIGLMGILADAMLEYSGSVIGVIPDFLADREVAHKSLTELVIVGSMHERKKRMADLSHAFVALPGGMGTLDELAEILTWKQLGLISKPIGILNTNHFFDPLINQLTAMTSEGFLKQEHMNSIQISDNPHNLLTLLGVVTL